MKEQRTSLLLRLARWLARTLMDAWPPESQKWGQALAAEAEAIQEPLDALRWAVGGVRLFARAWASHGIAWLNLPVGTSVNGATMALASGPTPRRSRFFTFALLTTAGGLLLVPESRQVVGAIKSCWSMGYLGRDQRLLQAMAAKAERSQDARTLAFVALASWRRLEPEATRIADRAVELEPSLAWIYAGMALPLNFEPKHAVWLSRMKAADPGNGFVDLLSADAISDQKYGALAWKGTPSERQIEATVENDSQWLSHLNEAFRAPRYESYNACMLQLFRESYRQNPELSPWILLRGFYGVRKPMGFAVKTYVSILVRRGEEASSPEDLRRATEGLTTVEHFGERLSQQIPTGSGSWLGFWVQSEALKGQKQLLQYRGWPQEAAAAGTRLSVALEAARKRSVAESFHWKPNWKSRLRSYAVHALMLIAIVLSSWLGVSLFLFELKLAKKLRIKPRLLRIAAYGVDYCPAILILDGITILAIFQPYARALHALVSGNLTKLQTDEFLGLYRSLLFTGSAVLGYPRQILSPSYFWTILTAVLSAVALFILLRGFWRLARG